MDTVEVKILQYTFHFHQLTWREEAAIKVLSGDDRLRTILSHAMTEVSGLKVDSKEAMRVLRAIPGTVIQRIFVVYKGSQPMPRRFSTTGLYKAPEPGNLLQRIAEVEKRREDIMDKVEREMEQKFGRQEIEETLANERLMLKNSKMRGATKATPDENRFGATPPPGGKKSAN
jgi:hypothetical protein